MKLVLRHAYSCDVKAHNLTKTGSACDVDAHNSIGRSFSSLAVDSDRPLLDERVQQIVSALIDVRAQWGLLFTD